MKKCPSCGTLVSIWQRDLFSGRCRKCQAHVVAEQERVRQEQQRVRQEEDAAREAAFQQELRGQLPKEQTQASALPPCPDCGAALVEIKLFGRGAENPFSGAAIDTAVVYYTDADASRSWWLGMLKERGKVRATICRSCHRIFLHGVPIGPSW